MSKIDFPLRQWQKSPTVGLPHAQYHGAELEVVLTRLASYNRRGRPVSQKSFFIKE